MYNINYKKSKSIHNICKAKKTQNMLYKEKTISTFLKRSFQNPKTNIQTSLRTSHICHSTNN